jgi:hypothetical protein
MDFSQVLKELKNGKTIRIRGNKGYYTLDKDNNIIYYDGLGGQATRYILYVDEILSDKWEIAYPISECMLEQSKSLKEELDKENKKLSDLEKYKADINYLRGQISVLREMLGK